MLNDIDLTEQNPLENESWVASGCLLEPLGSYLKSLGLLRMLGRDTKTAGYWDGCRFVLDTPFSVTQAISYFTDEVQFSPIITPWNGANGIWKKDATSELITKIGDSPRLATLKVVIQKVKVLIEQRGTIRQPSRKEKPEFIQQCFGEIKDEEWQMWAKACVNTVADSSGKIDFVFSYLLGTGGNIGARDLGANYLQAISYLVDLETGNPSSIAKSCWESAILGVSLKDTVVQEALSAQYFPNVDYVLDSKKYPYEPSGGSSTTTVNPADVVLLTEGLLLFSSIAKRKLESDEKGVAEYSLAVDLCNGTAETAVSGEARSNLEEFWLPIWREPLTFDTLRNRLALTLRGRLPRQGRPDTLDFAENIAREAKTYGIYEFQRIGFFPRKGKSNFAVTLGIFSPGQSGDLGVELTGYRKRLSIIARGASATQTLVGLSRQLEAELMALSSGHGSVISILKTLGQLELYLSRSPSIQEQINPQSKLKADWIIKAFNESSSVLMRLALSLSSLRLRDRLSVAVSSQKGCFWSDKTLYWGEDLVTNLIELQRDWVREEEPYPKSRVTVKFLDVAEFISGSVDLRELEVLAAGFSICKIPYDWLKDNAHNFYDKREDQILLPALYRLTALCHWSDFGAIGIVNALAYKNSDKARELCIQRLHVKELSPFPIGIPNQDPRLIAAAIAFPLRESQLKSIRQYLCGE
jgi:CRISPR-associated protein Csx17